MPDTGHCAECDTPLPANVPKGLCPRCALQGALEMTNAGSQVLQPDDNASEPPPQPPTPIGQLPKSRFFGDYELLEEIARGGMGVVFKARQKGLNRTVAVKMILAGQFASKDEVLRFRAEAESAARLQHPNIVRIYETGEVDGQPYFSMDYVEGANLATLVREKPLPAKRAAAYVKAIAEAIHYAHEQGTLHRDLKPSNILIDHADHPRVTDFGLAKRFTKESFLTVTGQVMGSPNFMPPEQAGAKGIKAGRYSDVYGLGAILFYLVTGRPPFVAETIAETLHHVLNTEPVSPRLLNPSMPADITTICLKCLEKEPAKRYQSAQQFADELTRFLNDEPIHARPVTRAEKSWRWCRRHPAVSIAIACAVLAAMIAALLGAQARHAQNQLICEQKQNAYERALLTAWTGDLDATETAIRDLELTGASVASVRVLRGSVAMHRGDYGEAAQHLEQAWRLWPDSVAVCSMLIKAYAFVGEWDRAQPLFEVLARLTPKTPEDYLFRGSLDALVDPVKALEQLDEAVRRRPTGIALLHRAYVRVGVAHDTARIDDVEAALADVNAGKALLPPNAHTIALSLTANLIATGSYDENRLPDKRAAAWRQAEADAAALERYPGNQAAILARVGYLKHLRDDLVPLQEMRASETNGMTDYQLAVALYRHGKFESALEILQTGSGPNKIFADYMRSYFLAELPNGPQLALKECQRLWQRKPSAFDTMAMQTALRLLGRKEEAIGVCRKAREQPSFLPWRKEWYRRLLDYNCGDLSEADLIQAAGPSRYNQSEAHFFIGMTRLADGDRTGARQHFQASVNTRVFHYFDYDWSRNFLARLEQDPNWPPWIPLERATAKAP